MPQNHIIIYVTYLAVLSKVSKVKQKKGKKHHHSERKNILSTKLSEKHPTSSALLSHQLFIAPSKAAEETELY